MTVRAGKKEGAGRNITSPHNKRKNDVSNNEHRPLKGDVLIPSGGKHREKKGLIYLVSFQACIDRVKEPHKKTLI